MDEEQVKTGEMMGEENEEIEITEDYTLLEGTTVIVDDDSDIQENVLYNEAMEYKEEIDNVKEELRNKILAILEAGEIKSEDNDELTLLQEKYTENYTALQTIAQDVTGDSKDSNESVNIGLDYDELIKTLREKGDWLYIDEDGNLMLNGELIPKLKVIELEAEKIKADVGEFKELTAENFTAVNAKIDNLEVGDLTAVNADITNLKALVAEIQTLIGGNLTMDNIQSLVLTSDKVTIANALIKNAMIDSISANKITTGTINTNNVSIQSEDGSMLINGTTQQFKDENNTVRIQIGKDAEGNFTFCLFSQDGVGILLDETGIHAGAVPDGLIVNDMVSDGANISGGKLDITSVISEINGSTSTIKSSQIYFDDAGQSLQVAFNQLKNKVDTIESITIDGDLSSVIEQVSTNTTNIEIAQGQISSLISNTTITKVNGSTIQLKDDYNITKSTVDSNTTKIGSLETNYNTLSGEISSVSSKQSTLEQDLNTFKTTVSNTYATKSSVTDVANNLANNYSTTSAMNTVIEQKANEVKTTVSETYATKETVTNLSNNLANNYSTTSAMNSVIKQKSNEILSSVSESYVTTSEFNDLSIGGKNLLQNTNFKILPPTKEIMTGINYMLSGNVLRISIGDDYVEGNCIKLNLTRDIQPNETITISFIASSWSSIDTRVRFKMSYGAWTEWERVGDAGVNTYYSKTFNVGNITANDWFWIEFSYGVDIQPNTMMIEASTKPSNWTPAPEDVDASIASVDSKFSSYSTTTQMNSAIDQKANQITTSVSNTYATKDSVNTSISEVKQTADKINWVIGSGTSQSNMTLTDRAYNLISNNITLTAEHINLDGYVSNSSDDPNWNITTDGNMEVKNMNVEGELSTDVLNCNVINNPNYPATLSGDINLYVSNLTGSDDYTLDEVLASIDESEAQGSADLIKKFYSLRGTEAVLPKNLNGKTVRIYLETDDMGQILFRNFYSGRIIIFLCSHEIKGYLGAYNCYADFKIYGGADQNKPTTYGVIRPSTNTVYSSDNSSVFIQKSPACGIYYCNIYGGSSTSGYSAVKVTEDCMCRIDNCNFYSAYTFVNASSLAQVYCATTTGLATDYAFKSYTGSTIHLANTSQANGKKGNAYWSNGSVIFGSLSQTIVGNYNITWDSSTTVTENNTTTSTTTTATSTYTSNYGDTYRSTVYNNWKKDNTCRQGDWGYGDCTGCWFFGTQFADLKGKTITKVTIKISRQSGGSSASVEHKLWMHNHATRPSGSPTLTSGWSQTFNLATNNSTTITITNSTVLNAIKNGTCKGFAIRHTYDSSHYSVCSGSATVKITYKEE